MERNKEISVLTWNPNLDFVISYTNPYNNG